MHKTFKLKQGDLEVEIGKFARQADGSVWIKSGNNVVLATAVATKEAKDFIGFFPLTVEYRERMSSVGKIPGGYMKREGRLSDHEVLTSRLIDRSIRPLFPKFYFNEVQVLTTVYSADGGFPDNILAMLGASVALTVSDIPFHGPIGAVKAAKVDGEWKFNVDVETSHRAEARILVAGTQDGVAMVEGYADGMDETDFIDMLFDAHELIKEQIEWQKQIRTELGIQESIPEAKIDWEGWQKKMADFFPADFADRLYQGAKVERKQAFSDLKTSMKEHFAQAIDDGEVSSSVLSFLLQEHLKVVIPDAMAARKKRIDDRNFDTVRPIAVETSLLPNAHGSGLFTRGETQVIASLTLGTSQDAQKMDFLHEGMVERFFMLHYNFPPFSTGEVRPIRGVGRREVGHGYLAEKSLHSVLPTLEEFPYTIRSVADVLESNGSSSMASVCATTMALMDGGVPIKDMVSGIAMGLIQDSSGSFHILTDILGTEDAYGLMDFKVTGTRKGVKGIQMDIKIKSGLTKELMKKALEQARIARLHILDEMEKVLDKPRSNLSAHAPRVTSFKVAPDKIGGIIGPGGKMIKEIIAQTGAQIDIKDDGTVNVFAQEQESADRAQEWIKILAGDIQAGSVFEGIVRRVAEFGLFVELVPGKDGLVHVSMIEREKQKTLERDFPIGTELQVKVVSYDAETGRVRLTAPSLQRQNQESK